MWFMLCIYSLNFNTWLFIFQGIKSLINELKSESCQLELMNAKECVAAILEATLNVKILSMVPLQDSINKFNFSMYT